jgi:UDP-N-acetylmuramoyl-tripeptide--D-alanyl-D-alanine ligase
MAELGAVSAAEHGRVADLARELGIRVVAFAAPEYGDAVHHVRDVAGAVEALGTLDESDAVLVKGSRVAGLERLAAALSQPH